MGSLGTLPEQCAQVGLTHRGRLSPGQATWADLPVIRYVWPRWLEKVTQNEKFVILYDKIFGHAIISDSEGVRESKVHQTFGSMWGATSKTLSPRPMGRPKLEVTPNYRTTLIYISHKITVLHSDITVLYWSIDANNCPRKLSVHQIVSMK